MAQDEPHASPAAASVTVPKRIWPTASNRWKRLELLECNAESVEIGAAALLPGAVIVQHVLRT
jgi:hypothetical protein